MKWEMQKKKSVGRDPPDVFLYRKQMVAPKFVTPWHFGLKVI